MAVGRAELELLLEAVRVLREENGALRDNFSALVTAHERELARAADAERAAERAAVAHAATVAQLHEELVAATVEANERRREVAAAPSPQHTPGVKELGLALRAAHAACAALLEENAALRRDNNALQQENGTLHAHAVVSGARRSAGSSRADAASTRDAAVQHADGGEGGAQAEQAGAQLVAQLRSDVAAWRRAAEAARARADEASSPPAPQPPASPLGTPARARSVPLLDAVPEADELSAYAAHITRRPW
jgi:hypothetical protein